MIALCNVVGSTIAREAGEENTLYTYAGPEIAVASTKAYITQVEMMLLIAVDLGLKRGVLAPSGTAVAGGPGRAAGAGQVRAGAGRRSPALCQPAL